MSTPLYQLKAEFLKTLGHPARIRILELLSEREHAVAEILPEVGIDTAHLLPAARRAAPREPGHLPQGRLQRPLLLTSPHVAELLAVARLILTGVLWGRPTSWTTCGPPQADPAAGCGQRRRVRQHPAGWLPRRRGAAHR